MVRKVSDAEARQMQERQARAAIRKLTRRLAALPDWGNEYAAFLAACRHDVGRRLEVAA